MGVGPPHSSVPGLQDIIGRLMILCARQPGLSGVWEALFQTEGKPSAAADKCLQETYSISPLWRLALPP